MKNKIITRIGAVVIGLTLATNVAYAQEAPATLTLQQEYQNALVQLITLLQAQVQSLIAQLEALHARTETLQVSQEYMKTKIDTVEVKVNKAVENTTPVLGAVVSQVKKDIGVKIDKHKDTSGNDFYYFYVWYSEDGKKVGSTQITIQANGGHFDGDSTNPKDSVTLTTKRVEGQDIYLVSGVAEWVYRPDGEGTRLTFSANGVEKTINL